MNLIKRLNKVLSLPSYLWVLIIMGVLFFLGVFAPKLSDNIGIKNTITQPCLKKFKVVMDKAIEYEAANGEFPQWKDLKEEDHDKYWNYSSFIINDTFYVRGTLRKHKVFDGVPKGVYLQQSIHGDASSNCKLFYTKYFIKYLPDRKENRKENHSETTQSNQ